MVSAIGCLLAVTVGSGALAASGPVVEAGGNHVTLVSRGDPESTATNGSITRAVSGNGRFVVFTSWQPNLVPGETTDGGIYVYLYDRANGTTTRISQGNPGMVTGNAAISGDGRFVVYSATDTPEADVNKLFRYDRVTGGTTVISQPQTPEEADTGVWFAVDISADGRYVVYTRSTGPDGDHINRHLYRYDAVTGATSLLVPGDLRGTIDRVDASAVPSVSADGRYVAYLQSTPTDPALGSRFSLILLDTTSDTKQRIVRSEYAYFGAISNPSVSNSGRYVAYALVRTPSSGPQTSLIYRFDAHTGQSALVSKTPAGTRPNDASGEPQISGNGRYVVYISHATDIVDNPDARTAIYLYDTQTDTTTAPLRDRQGEPLTGPNNLAYLPYIDRDGDTIVFTSNSRRLFGTPTHLERVYLWRR